MKAILFSLAVASLVMMPFMVPMSDLATTADPAGILAGGGGRGPIDPGLRGHRLHGVSPTQQDCDASRSLI
jgi:hypothetical protein